MFNPDEYESVQSRMAKYIAAYPDYRWYSWISREFTNEKQWVVIGELYRTWNDEKPFVTGLGFELVKDEYSLAKAETSAMGRCLLAAGYPAKPMGGIPQDPKIKQFHQKLKSVPDEQELVVFNNYNLGQAIAHREVQSKPEPIAWDVNEIVESLGAEVIEMTENCAHGKMILKQGRNAKGKDYYGFVCTEKSKADQCTAVWYNLASNGKWMPPLTRADV